MKGRVKTLRKQFGLTRADFGARIGVKANTITNYETGLSPPSDAVILSICREFGVQEIWLRAGSGEMFEPVSRDEKTAAFLSAAMREEGSYKKSAFFLCYPNWMKKNGHCWKRWLRQ